MRTWSRGGGCSPNQTCTGRASAGGAVRGGVAAPSTHGGDGAITSWGLSLLSCHEMIA
jgi:hypothetical protein